MLKIGLLGAGRISQVHAAAISAHPDSVLAAVSDVCVPAAEALATPYDAAVKSSDEIIADSAIDAVLVATSTDTHSDLIEAQPVQARLCYARNLLICHWRVRGCVWRMQNRQASQ